MDTLFFRQSFMIDFGGKVLINERAMLLRLFPQNKKKIATSYVRCETLAILNNFIVMMLQYNGVVENYGIYFSCGF